MSATPHATAIGAATPATDLEVVASHVRGCRYRWSNEGDLQAALHAMLLSNGVDVTREVRLNSRDRIDLLVITDGGHRIGIEVKISRPGRAAPKERVMEQLTRYASNDQIDGLVLVSTTSRHAGLPAVIGGVPVRVVVLGGIA